MNVNSNSQWILLELNTNLVYKGKRYIQAFVRETSKKRVISATCEYDESTAEFYSSQLLQDISSSLYATTDENSGLLKARLLK